LPGIIHGLRRKKTTTAPTTQVDTWLSTAIVLSPFSLLLRSSDQQFQADANIEKDGRVRT